MKYGRLGFQVDERYRSFPEERIIQMLVLYGYPDEMDPAAAVEACKQTLGAWILGGLGFRAAADGMRLFDPHEVLQFMRRQGLDGLDRFFAEKFVPVQIRKIEDMVNLSPNRSHRFKVEYKRTYSVRHVAQGGKLRLRAPLPLTGDFLKDLEIKPYVEGLPGAQISVSPGRLDVRGISTGEAEVILGAQISFTASYQEPVAGAELAPPDPALYLSEREGLIIVTDRVRELAKSLATPGMSQLKAVRAFWDYINENLIFAPLHYHQLDFTKPGDSILDSGWCDCQMGTSLLIALCRTSGIMARLVGGFLLYPAGPTYHYWAEIWIDGQGWTPFDFFCWDLVPAGQPEDWKYFFFGRLDYRMAVERQPREFTGALGVTLPPEWALLPLPAPGGSEVVMANIDGGLIYSDTVSIVD